MHRTMPPAATRSLRHRDTRSRGFTLVELMITLTILAVVMVVLMTVMYAASRSKVATVNQIESTEAAGAALDMTTRDLRSAGYGADLDWVSAPQPAIAYIDSIQVLLNANFQPYPDDTVPRSPLAYNPAGNPKPFPLAGTAWTPPIKYRRGAEIVRWTLDVNNDGQVNASDIADPNGVDAQRTPNPNDYVLVRQVYGDSTGNIVGNNGGTMQRVALVQKPGGSVPPMFKVYLAGQSTPWNWSSGPVPASKLSQIQRIEVCIVSASNRPDVKGQYAQTKLTSTVSSLRNTPNAGQTQYAVDGYVFDDANHNLQQDVLETGVSGATVRLGPYSAISGANGYFIFNVNAGKYTLRNLPPPGYGTFNSPDSFVVTVPPAVTQSLADTARAGGLISVFTFHDANADTIYDAGDSPLPNIPVSLNSGASTAYTDVSGNAQLFAGVGGYTVTATPPDSMVSSTANPRAGTMTNGGSASYSFGMRISATGTVSGKVYQDANRSGTLDAGENGVANVWVGVTPDDGLTVLGYEYTNATGDYSITVPNNVPPGTKPYSIMMTTPGGYYATSTTSISPIWLSPNQTIGGQNFGILGYQVISLRASRILSIVSGDLYEKQNSDNAGNGARKDADILLGADTGATDNISVWFNQYDSNPLFTPTPSYTRDAPQSVLALALDTLNYSTKPKLRPDLVTGTKLAAAGNFFVWFNQASGGNEGYFPITYSLACRTLDNGDVQAVLTGDFAGNSSPDLPDIIVGTKSSTANHGTIEIWQNSNATSPTFSRLEVYPNVGGIPSSLLGEVNCMGLADFDGDGIKDLVVGTKITGTYSGQLLFLRGQGKTSGSSRFTYAAGYAISGIVTALTPVKANFDAKPDVIIGVQTGASTGELQQWTNACTGGVFSFGSTSTVAAPGLVMSLTAADLGGLAGHDDLAVGWRSDPSGYGGGVRVYPLDSGALTSSNTDPSSGYIVNMAPCLTTNNFNYGVQPALPSPPYLTDLAAGVKMDAASGLLVIFVR